MRVIFLIMLGLSLLDAEITRDDNLEIITDSTMQLMWQDDAVSATTTWQGAIDRCENLSLGTYNDWRLPNINELKTIMDRNKIGPAIVSTFANTSSSNYWSSTTYERDKHSAWYIYFFDGSVSNNAKEYSLYVRCVRGGE